MLNQSEICRLLKTIVNLSIQGDINFRHLSQGITNESYWLVIDDKEYVLKIHNPDTDRLGLNRENEIQILTFLKPFDLCPETIFYSPEHNFTLSHWLPGKIWHNQELQHPPALLQLAQKLKQLHGMPCDNLPEIDLLKRLQHYRMMIQKRHGKLPGTELKVLTSAHKLLASLQQILPSCLCHNDLISANILSNNQNLYFLDWEYAAVNNPLFELAVITQGNQLSETNQQYFLEQYFGDKKAFFDNNYAVYCWFYQYLSLLWTLVIIPKENPLPENLDQSFQQLTDCLPNRLNK